MEHFVQMFFEKFRGALEKSFEAQYFVYNNDRGLPLFNPYLSWGKTGQIPHVMSPSTVVALRKNYPRASHC